MGSTTNRLDPEKARAFSHRLRGIINDGALALLLSIGHRTGLFDALADHPRSSAEQIAEAAGLYDQHVREWLEGMVRAGIVSHDPSSGTYELPPEHAAALARELAPRNLAAVAEYIPLLGALEDRLVQGFQKGGHTPYASRPSFRQVISKKTAESDQAVVAALVDFVLALVPGLLDALRSGIYVLDIGCGSGRAVNLAAAAFPKSRFAGYDPLPHRIERATRRAFSMGLTNVHFRAMDVADLDETERYDLITDFDAIRDQGQAARVLASVARALRPKGTFIMQEVATSSQVDESVGLPRDSALFTVSRLQRMAGFLEGPGKLTGQERVKSLLLRAGFEQVEVRRLAHHIYNCYFIATKA